MTIGAYTFAHDLLSRKIPFELSIDSVATQLDEVVIVHITPPGSKADATMSALKEVAAKYSNVKLFEAGDQFDWNQSTNYLNYTNAMNLAKEQVKSDYALAFYLDEVLVENSKEKFKLIIGALNTNPQFNAAALPILDYWGTQLKVRIDSSPSQIRITKKNSKLQHGIPVTHRVYDEKTKTVKANLGVSGFEIIDPMIGLEPPSLGFYTMDQEKARMSVLQGNPQAFQVYASWFGMIVQQLPHFFRFRNWNLVDAMNRWQIDDLYHTFYKVDDGIDNPFFKERKLSEVSNEEKLKYAEIFEKQTGGWDISYPWDSKRELPALAIPEIQPPSMKLWCFEHGLEG